MVTSYMFQRVRELRRKGLTRAAIARELGVDRKTVSKYLNSNMPPKYGPRKKGTRGDPFHGFEPRARFLLKEAPEITAREIFEYILEEGYRGSERTVDRRIKDLLAEKPKEDFSSKSTSQQNNPNLISKRKSFFHLSMGKGRYSFTLGLFPIATPAE